MMRVQVGEHVGLRDRRRGIGQRLLDAGLEDRIERPLLPLQRPQARAHDLAERTVTAGLDTFARHGVEWSEGDGGWLGGTGGHSGII